MFETSQQTNQRLYRSILDGKQYERFIPKTYCQRLSGGKGNTDYSVSQMAKVVELYSHQTQKVAQKLQKSSLQVTTQAIQDFLYWHFQYKRDEQDQMLRSPACSFAQRFEGIDCKSYSIFGASILRELGCVSYFRRVSYGQNQPYSHVYVVVPKNQKTADLSEGYYVIDGTINKTTTTENYFYKHSDYLVMKLNHYILNAPPRGLGMDPETAQVIVEKAPEIIETLKKIYKSLGLFSGATDISGWQKNAEEQCAAFMVPFITKINIAIAEKDLNKVTELYNDFAESIAILFDYAYSWGKGHYGNPTFKNNKDGRMNKIGIAYVNMFEGSYMSWFWNYFNAERVLKNGSTTKEQAKRLLDKYSPWGEHDGRHFCGYNHKTGHGYGYWKIVSGTLKFKSGVNEFKPFTVTPIVADAIETGQTNTGQEIINSLPYVINLFGNSNNNNNQQFRSVQQFTRLLQYATTGKRFKTGRFSDSYRWCYSFSGSDVFIPTSKK